MPDSASARALVLERPRRLVLHEIPLPAVADVVVDVTAKAPAAFARAIVQADQFGISLGRILRVQAVDTRHRRQIAAEEKAMKAPVKMLFPTVIFIFPSMFIVILGPAVILIALNMSTGG